MLFGLAERILPGDTDFSLFKIGWGFIKLETGFIRFCWSLEIGLAELARTFWFIPYPETIFDSLS